MPSLLVSHGDSPYKEYAFPTLDVITIGRAPHNAIVLAHPSRKVSRSHAALIRCADTKDEYFIRDLGSASGTRVGGINVQRKALHDGDLIEIADYKLGYFSRDRQGAGSLRIVQTRALSVERGTTIVTRASPNQAISIPERQELIDGLRRTAKARPALEQFVRHAMESLIAVLKADKGFIRFFSGGSASFTDTGFTGMQPHEKIEITDASFMERLQQREPVINGATLLVPIVLHNTLEGFFCLSRTEVSRAFTEEDAKFVMQFTAEFAFSIFSQDLGMNFREVQESCRWPRHFMGTSKPIEGLAAKIQHAAASDVNVLLIGEPGTSKNLIAAEIHQRSRRRQGPFIVRRCSQTNEKPTDSEEFSKIPGRSYESGKEGIQAWFQQAHGGTFFLDEIQALIPPMQDVFLLVLQQQKEQDNYGTAIDFPQDAKIVVATSRVDLESAAQQGWFYKNLLYRFGIKLHIPPLREHKEDIPLLVHYFLDRSESSGAMIRSISPRALRKLVAYDWPGNVGELEHVIEKSVSQGKDILFSWDLDLPGQGPQSVQQRPSRLGRKVKPMSDVEKEKIIEALEATGGNKTQTALELGLSRQTLLKKMDGYGIHRNYGVVQIIPDVVHGNKT